MGRNYREFTTDTGMQEEDEEEADTQQRGKNKLKGKQMQCLRTAACAANGN